MPLSAGDDPDLQIGGQLLAARFGPERQSCNKADQAGQGADCHRNGEAKMPIDREVGDDWRSQAAKDRTLVIAEAACRCTNLGREAFGEVAWILAENAASREQSLSPKNTTIIV